MQDKSNLRKIYEAIRGGIGSPMSGLGPTQEYMRDILKPEGFDERQAQADMSIREMFEIEFKRARERGDEVFEFMGKPYNTKTKEEVEGFATGDAVGLVPGGGIPSMMINVPKINMPSSLPDEVIDIFDEDFEVEPFEIEYDTDNPYNIDNSAYENYMESTRTAEDDARDDLEESVNKVKKEKNAEKMKLFGEMLEMVGASNDFTPLVGGQIIKGSQASIPQIQRFQYGGIAGFDFRDFDINDYLENILNIDTGEATEEDMATALARAYGAPSEGIGAYARSMGYRDTTPGASISIDAKDTTPDVYRFYPSEVSKIYAQAKGVPFSPLVAPPREATFIDDLQPRRIASQLYAKDGAYVQAYADGTGEMGVEDFPERDQLVTGPGGERGDKIPAMLSDGEFVTNSAAVRGIGLAAGADPNDEYEQRLLGAREMYKMQKFGEEIAQQLV
jgi:hypothetical protein